MLALIRKMLNEHEENYPELKKINNSSSDDLRDCKGNYHSSRPLATHVAYMLDGHHHNRPIYHENYDHSLLEDEKFILDKEAEDIARISLILHDPSYLFKDDDAPDDVKVAQEITEFLKQKHGPKAKDKIIKEVFHPYLQLFAEKVHDDNSALSSILAPAMIKKTPHKEEDYRKALRSMLLFPAFDGHVHKNWDKKLPVFLESTSRRFY